MKLIDETGNTYERIKVIGRAPPINSKFRAGTHALWLCQCECGNTLVATGNNLRRGHVRSCGCLRAEIAAKNAKLRAKNAKKETVD